MINNDFIYKDSENTILIGILPNKLKKIEFPKEIQKIVDFEIGTSLLTNCTGNNLEISFGSNSEVSYIGNSSFSICEYLTKADLSNCLNLQSLSYSLFARSSLETIILPMNGKINSFNSGCFSFTKIANIDVPDSVKIFGKRTNENYGVFGECSYLQFINISTTSLLTNIGYAFAQYSAVTSFFIPESVTMIAYGAFSVMTKLEKLVVDPKNDNYCSIDNIIYSKDKTLLHTCANNKKTQIQFEPEVITLAAEAFRTCQLRGEIIIPESITEISSASFHSSQFDSVVLHSKVEIISKYAFYSAFISRIIIPSSVRSIETGAFEYSKVKNISFIVSEQDVIIENLAFADCPNLISIQLPQKGLVFNADDIFNNSHKVKDISFIVDIHYNSSAFHQYNKFNLIITTTTNKTGTPNFCGIIQKVHIYDSFCYLQNIHTCKNKHHTISFNAFIFIILFIK